jgi:hypothetical protein
LRTISAICCSCVCCWFWSVFSSSKTFFS